MPENVESTKVKLIYPKDTLIARSVQSLLDMCDNDLLVDRNVHCTFKASKQELRWLQGYVHEKGGDRFSITNVFD